MNANSDLFDGKVAVATGASTGTGLGLSRKLLDNDARRLYQAIREGRPEYVEEAIRIVKAWALAGMEATAAAPAVGT